MTSEPDPLTSGQTRRDVTLSFETISRRAWLGVPLVAAIFLLPHILLWGWRSLWAAFHVHLAALLLIVPVLLASFAGHEALHGLGFVVFGRARLADLRLGFDRSYLAPYAHCQAPMPAWAYRLSTLLPGLLLGVVPGVVGLATGIGWLTLYGSAMAVAALGDVLIVWVIRSVPGQTQVMDHPSLPGCVVWEG